MNNVLLIKRTGFVLILLVFAQLGAQDPLRFQNEVNKLVAGDTAVKKKKLILFTGSSSVRLWQSLASDFPNYNVVNRGFGGSEMSDLIYYADQLIIRYKPKQVFIYEGDNDLANGKSPDEVVQQAKQLITQIRKKLSSKVQILFISPKPSPSRWSMREKYEEYNQKLALLCSQQEHVTFVDVWSSMLDIDEVVRKDLFIEDGLHMNATGYRIWRQMIGSYIKKELMVSDFPYGGRR
jgi:lysophospholipase L1-like esterase